MLFIVWVQIGHTFKRIYFCKTQFDNFGAHVLFLEFNLFMLLNQHKQNPLKQKKKKKKNSKVRNKVLKRIGVLLVAKVPGSARSDRVDYKTYTGLSNTSVIIPIFH